jgi:hypothetical protein
MRHRVDRCRQLAAQLAKHDVDRFFIAQLPNRPALTPDDNRCAGPDTFDSRFESLHRRLDVEQRTFDGGAAAVDGQNAHEIVTL